MARGKKNQPEMGLVARPVVQGEFDGDGDDANQSVIRALSTMVTDLVKLMTDSHRNMVVQQQVMAEAFTSSLQAQVEATKALQESLDKRDDRKLKRERAKRHDDMVEQGIREVFALAPVLANKFGKGPMLSAKEAALLQPLIAGLSKEELKRVWEAFEPSNRVVFAEILKAIPNYPDGPIKSDPKPTNGAS